EAEHPAEAPARQLRQVVVADVPHSLLPAKGTVVVDVPVAANDFGMEERIGLRAFGMPDVPLPERESLGLQLGAAENSLDAFLSLKGVELVGVDDHDQVGFHFVGELPVAVPGFQLSLVGPLAGCQSVADVSDQAGVSCGEVPQELGGAIG